MKRTLTGLLLGTSLLCSPALAEDLQTAIFAGGCFWCVESDFDKVAGVVETLSGYTGGTTENPTYEQVTGKAADALFKKGTTISPELRKQVVDLLAADYGVKLGE